MKSIEEAVNIANVVLAAIDPYELSIEDNLCVFGSLLVSTLRNLTREDTPLKDEVEGMVDDFLKQLKEQVFNDKR